ncbi:pseudoazurin [Antarcticimicrobium luteum]|uniref:Pseudoazurin n=1 Tax=Antarcticimicrobium luteum TaxID=2547397 RepID=A0A4R5UTC7_9RHOB|nr:pseudoazurin [Antarcticimicrobium luteum]TDK42400.1 pseudoazurin [Antarcticimicrobium luteum]
MFKQVMATTALALLTTGASAEVFEVEMLNRGEAGAMVFEPAYVQAQPGDTIRFVPTDKGHNVESIDGMLPGGTDAFKSKFNMEFELTVDAEGVYGVKCTPHYAMGMVALIQVGEASNLDAAKGVNQRGQAGKRFDALFAQVR